MSIISEFAQQNRGATIRYEYFTGRIVGYAEPDRVIAAVDDLNVGVGLPQYQLENMLGQPVYIVEQPTFGLAWPRLCAWLHSDITIITAPVATQVSGGPVYKQTCPGCRAPAHVGIVPADVDCSSPWCKHWRKR